MKESTKEKEERHKSVNHGSATEQQNVLNKLTSKQIRQYKTLFNLIDQDHDQKISLKDLKTTIVSLGMESMDDDSVLKMLPEGSKEMNLNAFLKLIGAKFQGFSESSELEDAFSVFNNSSSRDSGIDANRLKDALFDANERLKGTEGLSLTEEEMDTAVDDFSKENKISGKKTFLADKFIETISN